MKPLRVLLISEFPYKGTVRGGVESAAQTLAVELSQSDEIESVRVLNFRMEREHDEIIHLNNKLTVHHAAGQHVLALPTLSFRDVMKARKVARSYRPDVVHGQGTDTHGDVATRLGLPSVVTIHGVGSFEAELREKGKPVIGPARVYLTESMIRRVIRNAGVVISISEFDRQFCSQYRSEGLVSIPNALRREFLESVPVFPDSKRVLFTGLIIERKNVVGIVRAFSKVKKAVPDAVLEIAGPAPDTSYFDNVLKSIDPAVRDDIVFHGNRTGPELVALLKEASVSVLFSLHENLPVAIAEALALGKPVVSSRVGAVGEMITDGLNGFLVESGNEAMLADRLILLLSDPGLRRSMGSKGHEMAQALWNPRRVIDKTIRAYRTACAAKDGDRQTSEESAIAQADS